MKNLKEYLAEGKSKNSDRLNPKEIINWCVGHGLDHCTVDSKGKINSSKGVKLDGFGDDELPYKFGVVDGFFSVSNCNNLLSLKNFPDEVKGSVYCKNNKKLASLEGIAGRVKENFICTGNPSLISLKFAPKVVDGDFDCKNCGAKLTDIDVRRVSKVKGNIYV